MAKPTPAAPKPAPKAPAAKPARASRALVPAAELPGPKLDREGLKVHSSGNISEIFGPLFAQQDGYHRQVRMPEPPLLLADRMVGLDCVPGELGKGTIWTETDVCDDSWYVFQGRMPAGIMIESGQADLMLISYMGIDFLNQSDRVYRLLGCTLTYHGGLPRVGETLRYEIDVDGHANQGPVRLFFFHYDCTNQFGEPRLSVRGGQAGFFTEEELADSAGILWTPETGEHKADARVDAPDVICTKSSFSQAEIEALAAGDTFGCFGPGWEHAQTHNDTPRISAPPMLFFQRVDTFDPTGGPWKKGYLKATWDVSPDDWFFEGHFKNDPCMPGTLMFEGCLQALAFYLAGLGYTIKRDGWRFEPVPDSPIPMRCRGQVLPSAKNLTYEVFIEEVHSGPVPMVYADLLCTVDGLGAFHARRCGLQLAPAWPLDYRAKELVPTVSKDVLVRDGFAFDERSMMACAWGKGSEAFGPMYKRFDGFEPVPRLPGPPYLFMSRAKTMVDGDLGSMTPGTKIQVEWDIEPDAWYFDENGAATMPFCVFLEAALQPCGWLASAVGSALTVDKPLFFRNLDGTGTLTKELTRLSGKLVTDVEITGISASGGMIIESFTVSCKVGGEEVYTMNTVFGFFPEEALANQLGLTVTQADRDALHLPCDYLVDLTTRPAKYFDGTLCLPTPMLCMLDRVSGYWPEGGKAGKGRLRSEKDVDPAEWFFKAHFFQDPVQPGSLGLEAMIQLLQFWMLENDMGKGMTAPRFEPISLDEGMTWKYRGQVVPKNECIRCELDIIDFGRDERGVWVKAESRLWVDKLCIYSGSNIGMRIVDGAPLDADYVPEDSDSKGALSDTGGTPASKGALSGHAAPAMASTPVDLGADIESIDPATDLWVHDHCPTWTVPALPMTDLLDRLARAALRRSPGQQVQQILDARVHRWVTVDRVRRLRTESTVVGSRVAVRLVDDEDGTLLAEGKVVLGDAPADPVLPLSSSTDATPVADPYGAGLLFHGPALHLLSEYALGARGATGWLDVQADGLPAGLIRPGLLDGMTHVMPHDRMHLWSDRVGEDMAAYPLKVESLSMHAPLPTTGRVRVEARFDGFAGADRLPVTELQLLSEIGTVLVSMRLVEVVMPKGAIGCAAPTDRVAFLKDRAYVPGLRMSEGEEVTTLTTAVMEQSDWLPGTVRAAYGLTSEQPLVEVAVREHAAARFEVHPSSLEWDGTTVRSRQRPLEVLRPDVRVEGPVVHVEGELHFDVAPVSDFWDGWFGVGRWPVEDLYYGLIERFVRSVVITDPEAFAAVRGRPVLLLANHQVGIESLLASVVAGGLTGVPTVTIAKVEHKETWLGRLISHCFSYPGVRDPGVISFFDRTKKSDLARIVGELSADIDAGARSMMVHVEGTRSVTCRKPVERLSGVFLDLALTAGVPVVPLRFVGGLPVEPVGERLEFPVGYGKQDFWFGKPILPEELAAMPLKERKQRVLDAINGLGPGADAEEPLTPCPGFGASVDKRVAGTGAEPHYAVLLETLSRLDNVSELTERIVEGAREGALQLGSTPVDKWVVPFASWLYGPKGAEIESR